MVACRSLTGESRCSASHAPLHTERKPNLTAQPPLQFFVPNFFLSLFRRISRALFVRGPNLEGESTRYYRDIISRAASTVCSFTVEKSYKVGDACLVFWRVIPYSPPVSAQFFYLSDWREMNGTYRVARHLVDYLMLRTKFIPTGQQGSYTSRWNIRESVDQS